MLDDDSQTVELAGIEENQQILIEGTSRWLQMGEGGDMATQSVFDYYWLLLYLIMILIED